MSVLIFKINFRKDAHEEKEVGQTEAVELESNVRCESGKI